MASQRRIIKLQRRVLQAAALGSLKLLRTLLRSSVRSFRKEERKSQKRGRDEGCESKFDVRESRRFKKRSRKGGAERDERKQREFQKTGTDRKRNEVAEESSSGENDEDFDAKEDYIGRRKRSRRDEENETNGKEVGEESSSGEKDEDFGANEHDIGRRKRSRRDEEKETNGNASQEGSSSDGGEATDDHSPSRGSPGKQSNHGSGAESDVRAKRRRSQRKHFAAGVTVRSIINCRDAEGLSPLHHACRAGSDKLVKYLISKGASVHVRDSKGDTPLHIAAKLGPPSLISLLKAADADMEAFNDQGVTPSDILSKKEAATERATMFKDQQKWYSHLAEELSDNEDMWWGTEWGDESEKPDWDVPLLEKMAESRQGRGLYNEPFSLRDFLKTEKGKTQGEQERKSKRKGKRINGAPKDEDTKSPEVIGPKVKVGLEHSSYIQRWKTFSESYNLCLSYASVPFPVEEGKEDTLGKVLLQGINASMHKSVLRKEMLKWHPDKFLQKWGAKLQGPDHDRIVARVNGISEAIHQLYKTLTPVKLNI